MKRKRRGKVRRIKKRYREDFKRDLVVFFKEHNIKHYGSMNPEQRRLYWEWKAAWRKIAYARYLDALKASRENRETFFNPPHLEMTVRPANESLVKEVCRVFGPNKFKNRIN